MCMYEYPQWGDYHYISTSPESDPRAGCLGYLIGWIVFLIILFILSLLSSCTTTKYVTDEQTDHRVSEMLQRMDSLMHVKTVVQQDSTWRQEILRQFQSIREKSDTSHTMVVDTAGNVIREKIIINNVRETSSETDRQEREVLMHRLEVMDSTVQAQSLQLSRMDSLLRQQKQTEVKEVEKPLSWWQQARLHLANAILIALALAALIWAYKKRTWSLRLIK